MRIVASPYLLRGRSRALVARVRPSLVQLGTNTNFAAQSTARSVSYTSTTGDIVAAIVFKSAALSTPDPTSVTWGGAAMVKRSGIIGSASANLQGAYIYTIKGGLTGAQNLIVTPGANVQRIGSLVYDAVNWDGTLDVFTATHVGTAGHTTHSLTCNGIGDMATLFAVVSADLGNWSPTSWTNGTSIDNLAQGTTTGYGNGTMYRDSSNENVTITATGSAASASSALAAIAIRNA